MHKYFLSFRKILFLFMILCSDSKAQDTIVGQQIILANSISDKANEISGICKWRNKLLLLPQPGKSLLPGILMIDTMDIGNSITGDKKTIEGKKIALRNLGLT